MSVPNQETVHALSGAYAVDALDHDERVAFEQHLDRCPECQDEVASLRAAASLLGADTEVAPPPALRALVLAAAGQVRPLPPLTDRSSSTPPGPRPTVPTPRAADHDSDDDTVDASSGDDSDTSSATSPGDPAVGRVLPLRRRAAQMGTRGRLAAAAVAAAVVAVVGLGVTQTLSPDDDASLVAASQVLEAPDAASVTQNFPDGSSATMTHSPREGRAVLQTSDMADPPDEHVFEMWLLDAAGNATPAGLMESGGDVTALLQGDAARAAAVAVTVEPEGGSEQPTSDPIAMFDLEDA